MVTPNNAEKNSSPWKALPKGFVKISKNESDLYKIQKSLEEISQKIDNQKNEFETSKNLDYTFQGKLTKENLWFMLPITVGSAFLSVGVAISLGIFEKINDAMTTQQPNWDFITAYGNMGIFMIIAGLFAIGFGIFSSHTMISRAVKARTNSNFQSKSSNNQNYSIKYSINRDYQTHATFGIGIILIGIVFLLMLILNDRPEVDRWEGFDIARQHNITLSSLQFNIVTIEEKQSLHIFYSTNEIKGENPFLMFFIPYLGTMVNPEGNQFSVPGDWQTHKIPGLKTTILYKFFDCSQKEYCSDQYNMYFDFQEKIDSKQYYTHSVNVPFLSPNHQEVNDARNEILDEIPGYQIKQDWGLRENYNPILRVSVLDDSTEYNVIPDGYLRSHKYNRTGVTNSVIVWDVPDHRIDFHLDYVNPHERYFYDNLRTASIVLFGTGAAFLVVSFSEYRNTSKNNS